VVGRELQTLLCPNGEDHQAPRQVLGDTTRASTMCIDFKKSTAMEIIMAFC
jgi:hypothetical protein